VRTVREVVERMRLLTSTHPFEVATDAESASIFAAPDLIDQVFENLIGNAIKYSPPGSAIGVLVQRVGDDVHVAVSDQGIGISRDELDRIFNIFYRSPDPRAGHVGGLGLGLYISREIVTRHDGRLWAESRDTGGSTFHVSLPLASVGASSNVTDPAAATRG